MDFAEVGSGYGVAEGLIRGQFVVEWATDRHMMHAMFLQPRNTLLWRSRSRAPQYGHWFHCATRTAHFAENSLWYVNKCPPP